MRSDATEPEATSESRDDGLESEWQTAFRRRATVAPAAPVGTGRLYRIGFQFTPADRVALARWADDTSHGYERVDIEQGVLDDGSSTSYALVYKPGQPWSTWGLLRRGDHLEVWWCLTGKTVGRHARMSTALASLPHATDDRQVPRSPAVDETVDRHRPFEHSVQPTFAAVGPDGSSYDVARFTRKGRRLARATDDGVTGT